mmetsp:Transcript_69733/g.186003  ORF Transcript_69733/g.186003 Transcript_69733/m.186003 type:complete len:105 (-) Transcript_69733:124-438(-)
MTAILKKNTDVEKSGRSYNSPVAEVNTSIVWAGILGLNKVHNKRNASITFAFTKFIICKFPWIGSRSVRISSEWQKSPLTAFVSLLNSHDIIMIEQHLSQNVIN